MIELLELKDGIDITTLGQGWSFYAPDKSKIAFQCFGGLLRLVADYPNNADLVMRNFVAYDSRVRIPGLGLICHIDTPDGLRWWVYEQFWCGRFANARSRLEALL